MSTRGSAANIDDDEGARKELLGPFLDAAESEYEALASYCDALSRLSHAVHSDTAASAYSKPPSAADSTSASLDRFAQRSKVPHAAARYAASLEELRDAHRSLLGALRKAGESVAPSAHLPQGSSTDRRRNRLLEAMRSHAELSCRAIKTCCSGGGGGGGGRGPAIHGNGILAADSSGGDGHERRIVALAAIRASVARVKAELG